MNVLDLVRLNVKAMTPYASAREEFKTVSKDFVFMDANENPFDNGLNRYPDPQQVILKQKISELKRIPPNQILLGNGSDEVIDLIFRVFCEPYNDNVILLPPTYGMYKVLANTNAVTTIAVPLQSDFQPNVEDILKAQNSKSKLLFLCSPNNPTANNFQSSKIETLLEQFRGIIVIDEAYIDFSSQESWVSRLHEFPNLIIIQTLSKAYGMAGIRLGMCFASAEIILVLNKIKPPYNINQLTQNRALDRLNAIEKVSKEVEDIISERQKLVKHLRKVSFIKQVFPTETNFILARVDNANKRYRQLVENAIVVRNRTNQLGCDNCLRFTVGIKQDNIKLITILNTM